MKILSKAHRVLRRAINIGIERAILNPEFKPRPGAIMERLTPDERKALTELTSDEIKDAGLPKYGA
jgi:hypothetical protein